MTQPQHSTGGRRSRRIPMPRAVIGLGALAMVTPFVTAVAPQAQAAPNDEKVQLLSFNDYHGHVQANTPGKVGDEAAGGGEFLSSKLTELRAAGTTDGVLAGNSFTVAAGDLIGGSPYFSGLFHDEPSIESLNAMGLDVSSVGNHEFDEGTTELLRMQNGGCHPTDGCYFPDDPNTPADESDLYAGADFQYLAANVVEDAPDGTDDFADSIPPYEIKTTAGGKQIAFIGMTLEGTPDIVAAAGVAGFTFQDEIEAGNAAVAQIKATDPTVEAFVVLLHEGGVPNPFAINGCAGISGPINAIAAGLSPEIDAIVSGHTHQPYTCSIDDPDGNPRPVTSAFSYGRVVTEIDLELDQTGEVDRNTFTMLNNPVIQSELTKDPAVTAVIDKWQPLADEKGNDPVGSITEDITRGGDPSGSDRGVESAAGNLVADAQLAGTADLGAQIAFMNPGGVRSDLEFAQSGTEGDGIVTYGEAFTFQPFNNTMAVLPMTGAQIVSVLEEQCNGRPFLHLGVSDGFTYDLARVIEDGTCVAVDVTNAKLDGVAIDPLATYQVAANVFLADGGDGFSTFAEIDPNDRIPGPQDIDALVDYLTANSPVAPPSTDRVNEIPPSITSVVPARLLDTRIGPDKKTVDGEFQGQGRLDTDSVVELQVAGRGGVPVDASAAVLNIGVIQPTEKGFLTVYPCGQDRPLASNVNFPQGGVVSNAVLAQIGTDGKVCIYTSAQADLYADVNASVPTNGSPIPVLPARLLETRIGNGNVSVDKLFQGSGPIPAGTEVQLQVTGRGGVPAGASAVTLNVGAVNPSEKGYLTIYPCGAQRPLASSVNYAPLTTVSNSANALIGKDGKVCIYASTAVNVIADVNAYIPAGAAPTPLQPARLLDTRTGPLDKTIDTEFQGEGRLGAGKIVELQVTGRGGVPANATAVTLNVGSIRPTEVGYLTVYPCGGTLPPIASSVNYRGGDIISNSVVAQIGTGGKVCIFTSVETDLIADVTGAILPVTPSPRPE